MKDPAPNGRSEPAVSGLPTFADVPPGDLDGTVAREHFLGRTLEEAETLFRDEPYSHFADLLWMEEVAFRYYFPAAVRALVSAGPRSAEFAANDLDDAYALNALASALEHRLRFCPEELRPVAPQLAAACSELLANHRETFIANAEFYGDLESRYQALRTTFLNFPANPSSPP